MDDTNLRTASVYINNLLLSRGLLRNGQTIDFAHPERGEGGTDGTMGRIMGVVNDLILRRDRDATQRESLSNTFRTVRAESLQRTSEVEQLKTKLGDSTRKLRLADAGERALKMQLRSAEAGAKGLKEEMARMKSLAAQTRAQCANEVRKRERTIEGLKKHVGEGGRARGTGKAIGVATMTVVAGVGEKEANNSVSQLGENYDLRSETNEFLTELASGLSEDNEKLGALIRRMVETLKALSGWEKEGEQDGGLVVSTEEGYEAIAAEADNVIEHLRTLLTNPSFVPLEEVEVREEEILRLREGWERMEARWKDAVKMMDGWRKRMTRTGQTINLEELRLGMTLSPIKEGNAEDIYIQDFEDDYEEGDTQDDIDAMNDSDVPVGDLEEMSDASSFEEESEDVLQPQEAEIKEAGTQVDETEAAEAVDAELEDDHAIDSDDSWAVEHGLMRKEARDHRDNDKELLDHAQRVVDQTKRNRQMLTRTLAEERVYEREEEIKRSQEEEDQKQNEAKLMEKVKTKVERKILEGARVTRRAKAREEAKVRAEENEEMRENHREPVREQEKAEDEAQRLLLSEERRQPPPNTSARKRAARRMVKSESAPRLPKQPKFSPQTTISTNKTSKEDQPIIDSLVDNSLADASSTLSNASANTTASTATASKPQTGLHQTATADLAPAMQLDARRKRKSGDVLEGSATKRVAPESRMKQRYQETKIQNLDTPHLRNMSVAEQNEVDPIPNVFPADPLEPLPTASTRSTRSTISQKDVLSSSPLPEVPKLSPLRQAPVKEVPVKRKSVISSPTNEVESSSRSITYEHQFSPAKKSSLSREYHPSPIFSAPTLAPPELAVPQRTSSRRENEKPWDENLALSPVKLTNAPISSLSLHSLKSPERVPTPAEQPPQQSPLTMASIAAKLAATEREADATRVRAKLKAAKAKRAAAAAVAASTTTTKVRVKTGESPVKKMDVGTENMEECGTQPKKRKPMSREHRRSRRRSTLSPWELETLILGGVQESPSN